MLRVGVFEVIEYFEFIVKLVVSPQKWGSDGQKRYLLISLVDLKFYIKYEIYIEAEQSIPVADELQ